MTKICMRNFFSLQCNAQTWKMTNFCPVQILASKSQRSENSTRKRKIFDHKKPFNIWFWYLNFFLKPKKLIFEHIKTGKYVTFIGKTKQKSPSTNMKYLGPYSLRPKIRIFFWNSRRSCYTKILRFFAIFCDFWRK